MQDGHDDGAFDRGADDGGKLAEDGALLFGPQRHRILDDPEQLLPVTQQEEQQVQHDEHSHDEFERGLTDIEGLGGNELTGLPQTGRQSLLHPGEVRQPETVQHTDRPRRQGIQDVLEIAGEIQLSRLEHLVDAGRLLHQGRGDQRRWQDHNQHDNRHRGEGGQVRPLPRRPTESPIDRRKDDRQDRSPQNRAVERPEYPRECQRYRDDQRQEGFVFEGAQADPDPATLQRMRPMV